MNRSDAGERTRRGEESGTWAMNSLGLKDVFPSAESEEMRQARQAGHQKGVLPFSGGLGLGVSSDVNASALPRPVVSRVRAGAAEERRRGRESGARKAAAPVGS
jgi:hypothetical protein